MSTHIQKDDIFSNPATISPPCLFPLIMKPKSRGNATLEILALGYGNGFVGRVIAAEDESLLGAKGFCDFTAPGENVSGELVEEKKNFFKLKATTINELSGDRQEPPCPYFGSCGGCSLQHLNYITQRKLKLETVRSLLKMHAHLEPPIEWYSEPLPEFGYRRRVIFHTDREGKLGFYQPKSWKLQPIERCLIVTEGINNSLPALEACVAPYEGIFGDIVIEECDGKIFVELRTRPKIKSIQVEDYRPLCHDLSEVADLVTIAHRGAVMMLFSGGKQVNDVEYPVGHFSQVNDKGNLALQRLVLEGCQNAHEITELYAGAGNFSFPLAAAGKKVVAVEVDKALVAYGMKQAVSHNLHENLTFVQKSTEKFVRKTPLLETVVLDPPRGGALEAVEQCKTDVTKNIVYVSCSAATFARDSKVLAEKGYVLKHLMLVDMFPQGYHVELVGNFTFAG